MRKLKIVAILGALSGLLLVSGCSSQIDEDAKKVAKFKCEYDAVSAKMVQDPSNLASYQAELNKLAAQEEAMTQLTKKYRDNASPDEQQKFKQALLKAISEGCGK